MVHGIHFWRLVDPHLIDAPILTGVHSHILCVIAILLAVAAAAVLLPVTQRYQRSSGGYRTLWLLGGSLAMGTGIWAMHFTSMLAYGLPLEVSYNAVITLVSILPAVLASAYCIVTYKPVRFWGLPLQGTALSLAVGIGLMHYLGMEAIVVAAEMYYSPGLFALSIVAAYILALLGFYIHTVTSRGAGPIAKWGVAVGSVVLGLAVSGMHFIAMKATYFVASDSGVLSSLAIQPYGLVTAILLIVLFLIGLIIIGAIVDRRFNQIASSLHASEMRFSQLAQNTQMAIFTFDQDRVIYANPALCKIVGYSPERIEVMSLRQLFGDAFSLIAHDVLTPPLVFDRAIHEEFKIHTESGELRWIYFSVTLTQLDDDVLGLASGFDISYQKQAEYSLRELAYHDQLTKLANRTMFIDRLNHHLTLLARHQGGLDSCVILLDLDDFKGVNDSLGHQAGDQLLGEVAIRLQRVSRECDTVARLGGDEFVILFENLGPPIDWSTVADKLLAQFTEPVAIGEHQIEVSASIGVLQGLAEYDSADDVLRDVDIALYRAKRHGKSHWIMFDDDFDAAARRHRLLLGELKDAIQGNNLQLFFQPIVNVATGRLAGFEALARWQRHNGEWVSPAEFIPLAESAGMISDISIWALNTAARQLNEWKKTTALPIYISVNVAAVSFGDDYFLAELKRVRAQLSISPGELKIELTESMLMKNAESMLAKLDHINDLGFELMLDDFGTGYSSLAALNRLPISTVKIDQSFVAELDVREQAGSVIKTIISLAKQLDMTVISEGVETESQARHLYGLGCTLMQGYWFGKPVPAEQAGQRIDHSFLRL